MDKKITFCIPSKSNLRYLKTAIPSIRKNSFRKDHDITIFVDQDNDGTLDWLDLVKDQYSLKIIVNPNLNESLYGIGKAYDKCIEEAETDIVMVFHADMMLGRHADKNAFDLLERKSAVCCTRVEPPLHPNGGEKILKDFGVWPEEFKEEEFDNFVSQELSSDKVTEGIFAPWMVYREDFLDLGGHDPILKSCREDSDIFNRMSLAGFKFKQPWNSLVYHLTGRGAGSFDGDEERHLAWKKEMENSTKEFIRKWGSNVKHSNLMLPIIPPKYDIGIRLENSTSQLLELLEPWCYNILLDDEMGVQESHYFDKEQSNTQFNLKERIRSTPFETLDNEIIVKVNSKTFTSQDFSLIMNLPQIIKESGEVGEFELGNLFITIKELNEYQNQLIRL